MSADLAYIHGTHPSEQQRLAALNRLTNGPFIEFLNLNGDESVLEVGSGLGILASEVAGTLKRGPVIGVEYDRKQIAGASLDVPNLQFVRGDGHKLPFASSSFEVAYCRYVLEHVANPIGVLREMKRVLKPGGRVFVQENNDAATDWYPPCPRYAAIWQTFIELQRRLGGDPLIGKKLLPLLLQAGFREVELSIQPEVHWQGSPGFELWVRNMMALIAGAEGNLIKYRMATAGEIDAAALELERFMKRPDATALFYWNRASGRA